VEKPYWDLGKDIRNNLIDYGISTFHARIRVPSILHRIFLTHFYHFYNILPIQMALMPSYHMCHLHACTSISKLLDRLFKLT